MSGIDFDFDFENVFDLDDWLGCDYCGSKSCNNGDRCGTPDPEPEPDDFPQQDDPPDFDGDEPWGTPV